jgi:hypothetical protein
MEASRDADRTLVGPTEPKSVEKLLVQKVGPMVRSYFVVMEGDELEVELRRDRGHAPV